jgi:hypothetical protein
MPGPDRRATPTGSSSARARATQVDHIASTGELAKRDRQQDINLKGMYGGGLLTLVVVQIALADGVFVTYGFYRHWDVPGDIMKAWLAATVVEVIGTVAVVVRYLFPRRDRS